MPNVDRIALNSHPYLCFNGQSSASMSTYAQMPCTAWGGLINTSMGAFGFTIAGEFSNAITDCSLLSKLGKTQEHHVKNQATDALLDW